MYAPEDNREPRVGKLGAEEVIVIPRVIDETEVSKNSLDDDEDSFPDSGDDWLPTSSRPEYTPSETSLSLNTRKAYCSRTTLREN